MYFLDRFDVLMSKIIFKKWKNIISMYFGMKSYLKNTRNHTAKHALHLQVFGISKVHTLHLSLLKELVLKLLFQCYHQFYFINFIIKLSEFLSLNFIKFLFFFLLIHNFPKKKKQKHWPIIAYRLIIGSDEELVSCVKVIIINLPFISLFARWVLVKIIILFVYRFLYIILCILS